MNEKEFTKEYKILGFFTVITLTLISVFILYAGYLYFIGILSDFEFIVLLLFSLSMAYIKKFDLIDLKIRYLIDKEIGRQE